MLEEKDIQAIGTLLDQKLKENNRSLMTEIFGEMDKKLDSQKNEIFGEMDKKFDSQKNEIFGEMDKKFDSQKNEIFGEMDKKFDSQKNEIFGEMDKKFDEVLSMINETFSEHEKRFDRIETEIAKRPTRDEMFNWADNRFIDLELAKDRHDYLHIDELDKLPAPLEISKVLIERGYKQKQTLKTQ